MEVAVEIPGVSYWHAIDHLLTCLDLIGHREAEIELSIPVAVIGDVVEAKSEQTEGESRDHASHWVPGLGGSVGEAAVGARGVGGGIGRLKLGKAAKCGDGDSLSTRAIDRLPSLAFADQEGPPAWTGEKVFGAHGISRIVPLGAEPADSVKLAILEDKLWTMSFPRVKFAVTNSCLLLVVTNHCPMRLALKGVGSENGLAVREESWRGLPSGSLGGLVVCPRSNFERWVVGSGRLLPLAGSSRRDH